MSERKVVEGSSAMQTDSDDAGADSIMIEDQTEAGAEVDSMETQETPKLTPNDANVMDEMDTT